MATKRKRVTKYDKKPNEHQFNGFVNVRINKPEKQQFEMWQEALSSDDIWLWLEEKIDSDYKVGIRRDTYGGGVQASLTCSSAEHEDVGLVLTARAPDTYNAISLLMFKATILLTESWVVYVDQSDEVSQWG